MDNIHELEKKDEVLDQEEIKGPEEDFTIDDLYRIWNSYVQNAIKKQDMNLVTIMKDRELSLEENTITLRLDNSLQESTLIEYKEELMLFLRTKLNNFGLNLRTKIELVKTQRLYTAQDKFDHLIKTYPALKELKTKLGLELDF